MVADKTRKVNIELKSEYIVIFSQVDAFKSFIFIFDMVIIFDYCVAFDLEENETFILKISYLY